MRKYTLIVTEKPDAAQRIASALDAQGNSQKKESNRVPYYVAKRDKEIVVVSALGHLYTVAEEKHGRTHYPVFKFKWVPRYMAEKGSQRIRSWVETISKLANDADIFVDACDYDIEGSVIGYCILKYACGNKENISKRMKYSTLTKEELEKSYAEMSPQLDFALISAGRTRHEVDWLFGINLSRALTTSAKTWSGRYTTLSTGRVQGPTLKFVVTREKAIKCFVPTPFWSIKAEIMINGSVFVIEYEKRIIETKKEADGVLEACKGKDGKIEKITVDRFQQAPPTPFDLGALQSESYSMFGYMPMRTLNIAQRLYLDALISYPRTGSQKLPATINYEAILTSLSRVNAYRKLASELLAKPELKPNEGKKEDSAHPAIYPTGNLPEKVLGTSEKNILDLIIRRFMAVFGEPAITQNMKVSVIVNGHRFYLRGKQILKEGWLHFYRPYVRSIEVLIPQVEENQKVNIKDIIPEDKFTKPPARYNPGSLLRKMEETEIGTKATRASIIQTLYDRKYVKDERMTVTDLGFEVFDVLNKYCPTVVSIKLTNELENKMAKIQTNNEKAENVLQETVEILKPIINKLKENEENIGKQLGDIIQKSKNTERIIGTCPICKNGKLMVLYSRKTGKRFIGCTNYFKQLCNTSFPLPQKGNIKPNSKNCKECGWPTILVWFKGKHPWKLCFNPNCPSKKARKKAIEMQNMQ